MPAIFALVLVAVFAAVLFVPRLPRVRRVRAAGTAAVSPQRPAAAGGMAVPAVSVHTLTEARPFACDNGVTIGGEGP